MPKPAIDFPRRLQHIEPTYISTLIYLAIQEDINQKEDITSSAVFRDLQGATTQARILAKEKGVICGVNIVKQVFETVAGEAPVSIDIYYQDGDQVEKGDVIIRLSATPGIITLGERIGLNFMGLMSGISTRTWELVQYLKGTPTRLLDTRKTIPGYRQISKYAVAKGGGYNHRLSLDDMVLIKENHIKAVSSLSLAVSQARVNNPDQVIEVEVETLEQVREALGTSADIVMLDNMDNDMVRQAVEIAGQHKYLEVSGNVNGERLRSLGEIGVDFVSMGALTHTIRPLDISLLMD